MLQRGRSMRRFWQALLFVLPLVLSAFTLAQTTTAQPSIIADEGINNPIGVTLSAECKKLLEPPQKSPDEIKLINEIDILHQNAAKKLEDLTKEWNRQLELWRDKMVQEGKEQSDKNMPEYLKNIGNQQQLLMQTDADWIEVRQKSQEYAQKYGFHPAPSEIERRQIQNCQETGEKWRK